MTRLSDIIYLTEAQWRSLAGLLPRIHRETGLYDLPDAGAPVVLYQSADTWILHVGSEGAFAGTFEVSPDGSIQDPEGWN